MKLLLERKTRTELSTIGDLSIDGKHFCVTLEDTDRGLHSEMTLDQIKAIKIHSVTCIPTGTYKVVYVFSPKHKRKVPLLLDVKGFVGIEMHIGNVPANTDGCVLLAREVDSKIPDRINFSTEVCEKFWKMFEDASIHDTHTITIQ